MPRFPLISTLVVLAAVATMIALGFWQLGRMEEKEALIARYEAAMRDDGLRSVQAHQSRAAYRKMHDYCSDAGAPKAVAGRNASGQSGWVQMVRCNMGGMPPDATGDALSYKYVPYPVDVLLGWSRSPEPVRWDGGYVTGTVVPAGELGYKIVADPPLAGLQANAKPDPTDLPNNHLAYALQWFLFAATALVIYVLALRRKQRDSA